MPPSPPFEYKPETQTNQSNRNSHLVRSQNFQVQLSAAQLSSAQQSQVKEIERDRIPYYSRIKKDILFPVVLAGRSQLAICAAHQDRAEGYAPTCPCPCTPTQFHPSF